MTGHLTIFFLFTKYRKSHIKNAQDQNKAILIIFRLLGGAVKEIRQLLNIVRFQKWGSCFCTGFPHATS